MRGPSAPNKCGGRPLASKRACNLPTSLSSLSESTPGPEGPPPPVAACVASCGDGISSIAIFEFVCYFVLVHKKRQDEGQCFSHSLNLHMHTHKNCHEIAT